MRILMLRMWRKCALLLQEQESQHLWWDNEPKPFDHYHQYRRFAADTSVGCEH